MTYVSIREKHCRDNILNVETLVYLCHDILSLCRDIMNFRLKLKREVFITTNFFNVAI